jgi:hypothetical protein
MNFGTKIIIAGVAVAAVVGCVLILTRRHDRETIEKLRDDVIEDIVSAIVGNSGKTKEDLVKLLMNAIETGNCTEIPVLRIDVELVKIGANSVRRTAVAVLNQNKTPTLIKCSQEYSWDELPSDIRRGFIKKPDEIQAYCMLNTAKKD